ncbi:MAG TPA: CoA-binding protein [Steroidobacteraceae bacterium]
MHAGVSCQHAVSQSRRRSGRDAAARLEHHRRAGSLRRPASPELPRGERAYPTLDAAVSSLGPGVPIDIVDVFRRPEHVGAIVADCLRLGLPALWLQLDVIDEAAAVRAREAGMMVVMDRCILVERRALD